MVNLPIQSLIDSTTHSQSYKFLMLILNFLQCQHLEKLMFHLLKSLQVHTRITKSFNLQLMKKMKNFKQSQNS